MSNLSTVEKTKFEDLFGMSSGYVLDLNEPKFDSVFRSSCKININESKYQIYGSSKANRLRAFWDLDSNEIVAKGLHELLSLWLYKHQKTNQSIPQSYNDLVSTIDRLLGKSTKKEEPTEEEFLKADYTSKINFEKLKIQSTLIPIIKYRFEEALKCFQSKSYLATIFMSGSILEGLLLGFALQDPQRFNQSKSSPKNKEGKVKNFPDWTLGEFIDVAHDIGLIHLDVKKYSHSLRDFRNFIHPYQEMHMGFTPDHHTSLISLQVLKAAIASLLGERK